jgi:hypothetical protein
MSVFFSFSFMAIPNVRLKIKLPEPRQDDPDAGLSSFGDFVHKVLGIGAAPSCKCSACFGRRQDSSGVVRIAVGCTPLEYQYTAYGKVYQEKVYIVQLGKLLF